MTTSLSRNLHKPSGRSKIPIPTLAYFRTRTRMRMFTLVRKELIKSGITKAILAERLGKGPDQINHWLATPQNWTLDTLSDFLFAISGAELCDAVSHPLEQRENIADEEIAEIHEQPALTEPDAQQHEVVATPGRALADRQTDAASAMPGVAVIMAITITSTPSPGFEQGSAFGAEEAINSEINGGISSIGSTVIATMPNNVPSWVLPVWLLAQSDLMSLAASMGMRRG
jgi:hypothetical protein